MREFKKYKMLIVDDYFMVRYNYRLFLEKMGFAVEEANNGKEAMDKLKAQGVESFSLLMVDLMMPVMDGSEFMTAAREKYGDKLPPVLICSADSDIPIVKKLAVMGIAGYLVKPVDFKILAQKLTQMFPDIKPK